jgi:hypothetical protein
VTLVVVLEHADTCQIIISSSDTGSCNGYVRTVDPAETGKNNTEASQDYEPGL